MVIVHKYHPESQQGGYSLQKIVKEPKGDQCMNLYMHGNLHKEEELDYLPFSR